MVYKDNLGVCYLTYNPNMLIIRMQHTSTITDELHYKIRSDDEYRSNILNDNVDAVRDDVGNEGWGGHPRQGRKWGRAADAVVQRRLRIREGRRKENLPYTM